MEKGGAPAWSSDLALAEQNKDIEQESAVEVGPDTGGDPLEGSSEQPATPSSDEPVPAGKRRKFLYIGAGVVLILAIAGTIYWLYARQFESTDDAFVDGDIIQINPKVSAHVASIPVKTNQFVRKGDLLVELDPADIDAKIQQAKAQLETAKSQRTQAQANLALTTKTTTAGQSQAASNVETAKSNVDQTRAAASAKQKMVEQAQAAARTAQANLAQTRAQVPEAESNLHLAQVEHDRRLALFNKGDISKQSLDQGTNALQTAQAQLNSVQKQVLAAQSRVDEANAGVLTATENYRQALAQINLTQSQVDESRGRLQDANAAPERVDVTESQVAAADAGIAAAEAALAQAELELSYTKIFAPGDGYITRKTIEVGQLVQAGTPLMAISQSDDIWIVANFKETQLEYMQVGQPVDIYVDAFPNESFHGKVQSFQAGTGSRFSVLPSENATGNFVKVVQRVPIKIVFDEQADKVKRLVPGMSVEPRVKVR